VLIDTFDKSKRLADCLPDGELRALFAAARAADVRVALAGSLRAEDFAALGDRAGAWPDVVGVRGAACRDRRRDAEIDPEMVRALRRAVDTMTWRMA
jgi:(5-formylfuran-3-yl)methyl phosphate synthase